MAKYDWKVEPRDDDWSDDTYAYFLIHINLKRMVEYLTKEFKKDWWFKADYGQDNCYIVAENNEFPVRLFFTFEKVLDQYFHNRQDNRHLSRLHQQRLPEHPA